ncbi:MAG: tyrosine-protein phosphatase, partial [Lachnospiraceae bacterium]|nr:tyrosine-protein phosphatase [Lachnospiraceae bacterium]
ELLDCRTLDDAVITLIGYALKYYQTIDEEPDVDIYVIYDYILEKKFRTSQAPADFGEWVKERKSEYDEDTFDRMLEVYSEHGIESAGIRNIRSLGGYNTVDGRMTSDRLMRSGMLNSMTLEDADMILKRGINYIIDLRRESEQEQFPDVVIKGLNHETCVMSSLETTEYQKDIIGIAQGEDDNRHIGYAWMNGEYLKEFDGEKMYQDYFVSEQSVASLKKIVEIMLRDDCTGVIIHCRDGKDRTGVAAGFILRLLGVGNMDIKYDYLASAVPNYARTEIFDDFFAYYQYDDEIIQNSRREKSVDQTLMKRIVCWLTQQYGSVENYYKQVLGISDETVRALREKYTV